MVDSRVIEEILRKHRADLEGAARALIQAANRGGGEDNITAVLFAVEEGDPGAEVARAPDEQTREFALVPEEEDTLHPEDGIAPPPPAPSAVDTMVVPASDIQAAIAAQTVSENTVQDVRQAGIGRRLLALLVILALIAIIVVLVWWGLAR
jgi:hypothetical protein